MWKTVGREPCSQTPTYDTPSTSGEPATSGKQATARMLATARIPAAIGTPAGKGTTTSTAKTPATGGPVWKSYKSGRKGSQKHGCKCGSDKKNWWP